MYYSLYASWANDQLITGGKNIKNVNIKIRKKKASFFPSKLNKFHNIVIPPNSSFFTPSIKHEHVSNPSGARTGNPCKPTSPGGPGFPASP